MKDKFDDFLSMITEKTKNKELVWEKTDEANVYSLILKEHKILLNFSSSLKKASSYPIIFEVVDMEGNSIHELECKYEELYYNRLHALCRTILGKRETLSDTVDILLAELD